MAFSFGNLAQGLGAGGGGALGGAGIGAGIGSVVPGIGTALGAGVGAGVGGLSGILSQMGGSQSQRGTQSRYSPEMQQQFDQLLPQLLSRLGGSQFDFGPIAQQAQSRFEQQGIPSLAERFTSMGQGRASSPAFASAAGQARSGLDESLASMQSQYGMQQQNQLMQLLQLGQNEPYYQPRTPSAFETALPGLMQGAGQAAGAYFGRPDYKSIMDAMNSGQTGRRS